MDGKAVIQALALPRGPTVGTFLEEQVKWMLLHPNGSREECKAHLLSVKRHRDEGMVESHSTNDVLGMSDGIHATRRTGRDEISTRKGTDSDAPTSEVQGRHYSKKMHVELLI